MRPPFRLIVPALIAVAARGAAARAARAAARLPLGTDSLEIYLVRGAGPVRVGMLWDELTRVDRAGRAVLRRVYRTENAAFGPTLDTTFSRWPDLGPVSHRSDGRQAAVAVAYRGDSVAGRRALGAGPERRVARRLPAGVYDGATFDLVVRAAPLAVGYELTVPAYIAVTDTLARLTARVVGSERLPRADGGAGPEVWRVEMDFAGLASTMWIAKDDRRLVRQTIRLNPQASVLMARPGVGAPGA